MNNRKAPPSLTFRGMADARGGLCPAQNLALQSRGPEMVRRRRFSRSPPSLEDVVKKYRVPSLLEEEVHPCFILADGTPVGYIQFYPIRDHGDGVWGIDLLIGEDRFRAQGHRHLALAGHDPFSV